MLMRRKSAALFCLVVLALPLVLISCGGSGGGNNGRSGTVAGTIRDTGSGAAIAGATVSVFNGLTQLGTTTTDANGDYTLNVQAEDGYTVQVSAPGYATLNQNSVTVAENATTTLNLQATSTQGTLEGVVRNFVSGLGIAGATVNVYDGAALIATTTTDANGNYTVDVDAGNDYTVEVDLAGFVPPNYNSVDVVADETTTLESILLIPDTFVGDGTVSGTIRDSLSALGVAGVTVSLREGLNTQAGAVVTTGTTDGAGLFSIANVPVGYYTAELAKAGYVTAFVFIYSLGGQVTGDQNASISLVTPLTQGTLAGVVSDSVSGLGIAGATVNVYNGATLIGTTTTGANGNYSLNVPAGSGYSVQVSATGYTTLNQNSVTVAANATTTLNLQPTFILGTLAGVVRDSVSGLGIAGATVEVYNGATLIGTTTTDGNGNYTLNVPPGSSYTIQVSDAGYNTLTQTNVTVAGNATTTLNLNPQEIVTQGTLEGVVRNFVSGLGIAGATINVYDDATLIATTTTDANGNYSVEVDTGNDYTVEIDSAGFIPATYNSVDIVADETTILEAILQIPDSFVGNGTVSGTIKDSLTGNGLAGVTVNLRAGLNTQTGAVVTTGTTNGAGLFSIANVPTGYYTAELAKTGYIIAFISIYSLGGQTTGDQNASISPVLAAGETRIVLTWGGAPSDLDSHLTGPTTSGGRFHIYCVGTSVNDGTVAQLDADDTTSYGPETVTISTQIAGVYRYSVYDYTNKASNSSTALSNSGAQVKVYQASGLVATYNIPSNLGGTLWAVFELSGNTLTALNTLSYNTNQTTIP